MPVDETVDAFNGKSWSTPSNDDCMWDAHLSQVSSTNYSLEKRDFHRIIFKFALTNMFLSK